MMEHMTKNLPSHRFAHAPLAGFERRLYAIAIDMLLLSFIAAILRMYQTGIWLIVLQAGYFSFCWSYCNGQTLGNKIMHIRVVSVSGDSLSFLQALLRYFGFFLSEVVFFLGFAWILWDKQKQGWHDKIAHTIVVTV